MTILVTGGTGLLGRAVIQSLVDQGIRPRVVTRRPHRALEYFDHRVTAFEWHPRTEPLPAPALEGVERIIHLMGEPLSGPLSRNKRDRVAASRRGGTRHIAEALRYPVHLVVASSTAVYGFGEGPAVSETSTVRPPKDKLALALLSCEEEAQQLSGRGSTVTVVRLGHIIAPGGFTTPLVGLHKRGITWRDTHPDAAIPAIDHADAVALLVWLAQSRPLSGPVHGVAPLPLRSAELKKLLLEASARRTLVSLPRWALRPHLGLLAGAIGSRQQITPQRAVEAGFVFSRPDPAESVRALLGEARTVGARPNSAGRPSLLASVLHRPRG